MLQRFKLFSSVRSLLFALVPVLTAGVLLFSASSSSSAQNTPPEPTVLLTARLTGAQVNGVRPLGAASYSEFANGVRVLNVGVDRVRLPNGTTLDIAVDGENAGRINVRFGRGFVRLSTARGANVPNIADGSAIVITRGDRTVLTGQFGIPPAPPTSRLFAPMEGAAVDGTAPRGVAHYAEFGGDDPDNVGAVSKRLAVFVHRVNLPAGSTLTVSIDGAPVGLITINQDGDGGLRLSSENGDAIPDVVVDSAVSADNGDASLLAGTFREFDRPLPPRFRRNRLFGGHMNGRQVIPSVETLARGKVIVLLDRVHLRIGVKYGFRGLSGNQATAAIHGPAHRGETAEPIFQLNVVGGSGGVSQFQAFDVTPEQIAQLRTGHWYIQIGSEGHPDGEIRGQIRGRHRRDRFLGNESADIAVYRPSNGTFFVKYGDGYVSETIGRPGDVQVSGDYDGDGTTDFAVFGNGSWIISRSSDGGRTLRQFGIRGDFPSVGDFDGDGRADLAVFRPSTGYWYVRKSGGGFIILKFGTNGDVPIASDFDGDGATDIAVFRESDGTWHWLNSSDGRYNTMHFGAEGDTPIRGDFDGDGIADISVFRNATGVWYSYLSSNGGVSVRKFGNQGDIPAAADFDGDGITDFAVFRPVDRNWHFWTSSSNSYRVDYFGIQGDLPTTAN